MIAAHIRHDLVASNEPQDQFDSLSLRIEPRDPCPDPNNGLFWIERALRMDIDWSLKQSTSTN